MRKAKIPVKKLNPLERISALSNRMIEPFLEISSGDIKLIVYIDQIPFLTVH